MIVLPRGQVYHLVPMETECPLCHCANAHLLYSVTSEQAAQHIYGDNKAPELARLREHIENLWGGRSCDFVQCDHCSLSYAHPFTPGDSTFYELVYQDETNYGQWKWEFQVTLAALQPMLLEQPSRLRLLEIGAGNGTFARNIAPSLIPKNQVVCTEHSAYGRNEIAKYGVECLPLEIQALDVTEHGKFDVVCMFEVLEHLGALDTVFGSLSRITNDGAHLFIGVPNSSSRAFYDRLGFVEDVPPTHISRWNRQCFEYLANGYGWRLVDYAVEPESRVSKIAKYGTFHYPQSVFAPYLEALSPSLLRRALKTLVLMVQLAISPWPSVFPLMSSNMGCVQWAQLEKTQSSRVGRS
jgi:SAM-dependent methyltransferase